MKLPEEMETYLTGVRGTKDSYYDRLVLTGFEAIVRDCAKVCFDAAEPFEENSYLDTADLLRKKGYAILARYGLEPKP